LWTGKRVSAVDSGTKRITLEDGQTLDADAVVLATGSRAKSLPIEGADLEGCFTLRSLQDATAVRAAADKAKNVVVIGASFIGTETAAYLRDRGLAVHVVAPERVPFAHLVGERVGKRFASMHEGQGVELHLGKNVSKIAGGSRVERVELDDGSSLPADLVIMGVGAEPVVDYLEGSGLVDNGAVPVDTRLETKVPGIYAVGDIARVSGGRGNPGEHRVEHWIVAERHGQEAARSITGTGQGLAYAPFFWTRQFETSFGYVGFSPDYDDVRYKGDVEEDKFLVGYFRKGELTAVGSIGKNKSLIRYGYLLDEGKRVTVEDFEAGLKKMGPK
jgi:NADPH-dependent 2,4-dienoyl-CoA reductase/sulfur reductase-like enzyme